VSATNPSPTRITAALFWFWCEFQKMEPHARLGGVYANKPGYHNIRKALPRTDYSVRSTIDRSGPDDKSAAIDITFPDAQGGEYATIERYSRRLLASGRDRHDERGNYLREFFGNTNADHLVDGWDYQQVCGSTSPDDTHLWHIHISIGRGHVTDYKAMRALLSILDGESVATWRLHEARLLLPAPKPKLVPVVPRHSAPVVPVIAPTVVEVLSPSPVPAGPSAADVAAITSPPSTDAQRASLAALVARLIAWLFNRKG
jgi:hypothetical protein